MKKYSHYILLNYYLSNILINVLDKIIKTHILRKMSAKFLLTNQNIFSIKFVS